MSIVPIFFRNWWDNDWDRPVWSSRLLDQNFGSGVSADDLLSAMVSVADAQNRGHHHVGHYKRPWHRSCVAKRDNGSTVNATSDKFQINLDVQQFSPEEISVKYVDKCIVVEGKHEEKEDEHGFITRSFVRRYMLPNGHSENDIVSSLSSDGILTITCPKKELEQKKERAIPITHTGQPMKKLPEKETNNKKEEVAETKKS
ncbi:protein lethal(2)essential for life-like [Anopheles nili]|uniref:protein lethal(2)essential for life-like n=1 Tax=Anopheles nili TaxID=185578 RepID=UPI00237A3AB0|nr:protein lethal(2)essential for life-like [Anopheles nili]